MWLGDLSRASAKVKSEVPGRTKQVEKTGEKWASEAGAKLDGAVGVPRCLSSIPLSAHRVPGYLVLG